MSKRLIFLIILLLVTACANADVIWLKNGKIFLGKVISAQSSGVEIETFGEVRTISQNEILMSENNLNNLKRTRINVTLKDNSVLMGEIQNYDDEIGIFLSTDFGTLTLPILSIKEITEPKQIRVYNGAPANLGFTLGFYSPMGNFSDNFESSTSAALFYEINSSSIRGLYIGASFYDIQVKSKDKDLKYTLYVASPYLIYRYLGFELFENVIPFGLLGFGLAYTSLENNKPAAQAKKTVEIDPALSIGIGTDVEIGQSFAFRFSIIGSSILQEKQNFEMSSFEISALYVF